MSYMSCIVELINKKLTEHDLLPTNKNELLQYFGVLLLCTRFEVGDRTDLWNTKSASKYIPCARFGQTGISKNRFKDLTRFISFSTPSGVSDFTSATERW